MTLYELRESKGISQHEMARRLQMTQPAISRMEREGSTTIDTFRRYAKVLDEPLSSVLDAAEQTKSGPPIAN